MLFIISGKYRFRLIETVAVEVAETTMPSSPVNLAVQVALLAVVESMVSVISNS